MGTPWRCSTSAAAASRASPRSRSARAGARPNSHERSSRSWLRARPTTARGSSARRWMSASVWRTESCRCAAISARSSERMRSLRSSTSAFQSRQSHGPKIRPSPPRMTATASRPWPTARNAPWVARNAPTPATTSAPPTTTRSDRRGVGRARVVALRHTSLAPDELADQLVDRSPAPADDQGGAHGREHDRPEAARRRTRARSTSRGGAHRGSPRPARAPARGRCASALRRIRRHRPRLRRWGGTASRRRRARPRRRPRA